MRASMILLALASLSACDRTTESQQPVAPAVPTGITYDGASATDTVAKLKHGERLSWILGCKTCHGENLQGTNVTADDPDFGAMNAPNITLLLAEYSDAELDRLIRHGVPKDGREFWFMPPESYQFLSDADFAALIAHLRTFNPAGEQMPPIRKGPEFLELVEEGEMKSAVATAARFKAEPMPDLGPQHALGRYIAQTTCSECHNSQLQGYEDFSPNLDIAGAYSAEELKMLLTTGKGKAKPDLGLMSETARNSLSKLTPRELDAIVGYLKARADRPQPAP